MNINRVVLTGNLTRDPELRATGGGTSVCDLGIAVNSREKVGGDWQDRADFFNVTVWGNQAENAAKYLTKGSPVAIDGRLRFESWEADGQKRSAVKIVAQAVQYLSTKGDGESQSSPEPVAAGAMSGGGEDDIPFARPEYGETFGERLRWRSS
jgi:single-strand DNA-binding protein